MALIGLLDVGCHKPSICKNKNKNKKIPAISGKYNKWNYACILMFVVYVKSRSFTVLCGGLGRHTSIFTCSKTGSLKCN